MRTQLQQWMQTVWPAIAQGLDPGAGRQKILKQALVLLIIAAAGPDLFVMFELTTLLEVLGASFFLLAFVIGFKIVARESLETTARLICPREAVLLLARGPTCAMRLYGATILVLAMALFLPYAVLCYLLWSGRFAPVL